MVGTGGVNSGDLADNLRRFSGSVYYHRWCDALKERLNACNLSRKLNGGNCTREKSLANEFSSLGMVCVLNLVTSEMVVAQSRCGCVSPRAPISLLSIDKGQPLICSN